MRREFGEVRLAWCPHHRHKPVYCSIAFASRASLAGSDFVDERNGWIGRYSRRTLPRFASGGADTFGAEKDWVGGFGSSLRRICFKLRTRADDWRRS